MVRHWNGSCGAADTELHHDVTASPPGLNEPMADKMRQTSFPDRTLSLANRDLEPGHVHL